MYLSAFRFPLSAFLVFFVVISMFKPDRALSITCFGSGFVQGGADVSCAVSRARRGAGNKVCPHCVEITSRYRSHFRPLPPSCKRIRYFSESGLTASVRARLTRRRSARRQIVRARWQLAAATKAANLISRATPRSADGARDICNALDKARSKAGD